MASFLDYKLTYEMQGPYVMFTTNAKIKFDQSEIGKKWRLEIIVLEEDKLTPDDIFQDENWSRTFTADKEIMTLEINTPISKRDLNTELGNEEIYAKLKVTSPDRSSVIARATTEIIKLNL